jgi:hypothetical protein
MTAAEFEAKYKKKPFSGVSKEVQDQVNTPGFLSRVRKVVANAGENVNQAISGTDEFAGQSSVRRGFEATAQAFNTVPKIGYEALPEVARQGLSKAGEVVGKGFQAVTNKIGDSPALQDWVMKHPEAARSLEEVAGIGSAAGQIAGDILIINQGAKLAQVGAEAGAKAISKVGQGVSKVGEKVFKSAYTPTADEARLLQGNQAKVKFLKQELAKTTKGTKEFTEVSKQLDDAIKAKPVISSDTALRKGIAGTEKQIGVQSNVEKLDLWKNKIEPALKNSKETITKDELFAKAAKRVAEEVEPSRKADFQRAFESLQDDYKDFSGTDMIKANQIKTSLDKFTPSKIFKGQDVASEVKTLKADMADAIRDKTRESITKIGDQSTQAAYRDYSNLKELEKVGIKALTTAGKKGGFGNFWTTVYEQATTPVKTIGGKVLYRVGNKLEFIGEKGVETLGEHLENIGAVATLKSSLAAADKQAGFVKNPLAQNMNPVAPKAGSTEQLLESATGWKPGMRQVFDTALLHEDSVALKSLLSEAPAEYVARYADKITKILSKKP